MTRTPRNTALRLRGPQSRPPRVTPELIADLAYRLTHRDRDILTLIWEHRVLTTGQLTAIFFPSPERARQRLNRLYRLHALLRFRPWTPTGSVPWHWVLGPAGAHVLAAQHGQSPNAFGYRQDAVTGIAVSPRLGHQTGVNDFFAQLHAHARHRNDGTRLDPWWSEHRCASLWGDLARPDAYGRWTEFSSTAPATRAGAAARSATLDFFLEHDTGTGTLARVAGKLGGYADLAEATGTTTPVLFWLPSPTREANLRKLLGDTLEVPVATAVHTPTTSPDGPAGPIWQPAPAAGPRHRLAELAHLWSTTPRPEPDMPHRPRTR
ncbi:replication-relaxation family protein [Actinomadura roseirufa]|uniref:replication-relaxation family protein n=1 Tax=Actinomadura roseirufa TaxID=2094049 RepID=UPI001041A162|nr:replication-relaxation family protein [Actinomadura roseirufa]